MKLLVPNYYLSFRCKAGACRSVCCSGWPVTFSIEEYYRLLSLKLSPGSRRRLDAALHLTSHPTREEYAMLLPAYDGQCAMRREDGLCAVQCEAGERALPAVCRLYPRGLRQGEASCANSCEAVIQLLMRKQPISFVSVETDAEIPAAPRVHFFETCGREMDIRLWLISLVKDRSLPLPLRLSRLGAAVRKMDAALLNKDTAAIDALISGAAPVAAPAIVGTHAGALRAVSTLLKRLDSLSDSIREYGSAALARFRQEGEIGPENARARLDSVCPCGQEWLENLLVNHMFFTQFPFQDRPVSLKDEVAALYCVYALLEFLLTGAAQGSTDSLVDIASALFRLADHTAFDRYSVPIIREIYGDGEFNELLML